MRAIGVVLGEEPSPTKAWSDASGRHGGAILSGDLAREQALVCEGATNLLRECIEQSLLMTHRERGPAPHNAVLIRELCYI